MFTVSLYAFRATQRDDTTVDRVTKLGLWYRRSCGLNEREEDLSNVRRQPVSECLHKVYVLGFRVNEGPRCADLLDGLR